MSGALNEAAKTKKCVECMCPTLLTDFYWLLDTLDALSTPFLQWVFAFFISIDTRQCKQSTVERLQLRNVKDLNCFHTSCDPAAGRKLCLWARPNPLGSDLLIASSLSSRFIACLLSCSRCLQSLNIFERKRHLRRDREGTRRAMGKRGAFKLWGRCLQRLLH